MSSVSVRQYSEVGGKQDEAVLEREGKWDSVGEVKPLLPSEEIHLADQDQLSPEEIHSPDQNQLSPEEIHFPDQDQLPPKETHLPGQDQQEALEDVAVDEGTDNEKNLSSDLATVVNYFVSEPEDLLCLAAVDDASLAALSLPLSEPDIFMENQALMLERCPTSPIYSPDPTLEYKDDTKDIESILESITSKVLTSTEKLEKSGHMGGKGRSFSLEET
ncbi:uncharacterized protein LOC133218850 [Neopsephotus bourkii]|uniref:uncharacterized protein LOC133218850 n=1 Tax=Neopsephotus bourkii TaxID=309878 RepID=UPI002AA5796B|nr:uncharacterized protein LOC133218850 [Neopsephotus bourkii]